MGPQAVATGGLLARRPLERPLRVAFLGDPAWLSACCPPGASGALLAERFPYRPGEDAAASGRAAREWRPDVCVAFDPASLPAELLAELPGARLGIILAGAEEEPAEWRAEGLDRLASFRPELTAAQAGGMPLWRAFPPPVADELYAPVRPMAHPPRAMSIGRATRHREDILTPAKHHHDLLQAIHGVEGAQLARLLAEHDVGVYVPPWPGPGFGVQAGVHLAAGQLLVSQPLGPAHGLERGIDYVQFHAAEELVWILDRLRRFPEMHQRERVRGRMKAEWFRASRLFERIAGDLLADIAAFG
ncbi:MAG TPA: hypothetical protein VNV44_09970 [Solirubrobacteraceae bacterium]|jgi:hypothetical protein|nr:hypothetical protein [Solirubrobacteraceae bacterium]